MHSGKTTDLVQEIYNLERVGKNVGLYKPRVDTKGGNTIVSQLGYARECDGVIERLRDWLPEMRTKDYVFVDEAQFMPARDIDMLAQLGVETTVICYGIRCDGFQNPWKGSARLLQIADRLEEFESYCEVCGGKASRNTRFINGVLQTAGQQDCIENFDDISYKCVCTKCWFELKKSSSKSA